MKNRWPSLIIYSFLIALLCSPVMPSAGDAQGTIRVGQAEMKSSGASHIYYLAQGASSYPRNQSSGYLGELYQDQAKGFAIRPPAQWWLDRNHPRFAVKFSSRSYEAFLIVDVVPVPSRIWINQEFTKFILEKNGLNA